MADPGNERPRDGVQTAVVCAALLLFGCAAEPAAPSEDWTAPELAFPDEAEQGEFWLSQTGLYRDITRKQLAPDLLAFEPAYALWSDAADKQRWLRLPPGTHIDTSEMDHWQFPVGTLLFKEFSLAGKRIETRVIARTGRGSRDYWMGAFVWNDDESDARFEPDGKANARQTEHDVPKVKNCFTCHNGEEGRILGLSAVQRAAIPEQLLSDPQPRRFEPPGDATIAAALGYLHANCAHCHNPDGSARPDTDMNLRLSVADRTPEATSTYRTTLGKSLQYFKDSPLRLRIAPGHADESGVLFRMMQRGPKTQMPSLGTELIDEQGIASVRDWIDSLSGDGS